MSILLVGCGGFLGAMSRYYLCEKIKVRHHSFYPLETFFVNLFGAILLGIVMAANLNASLAVFLGDGFLGAFTTFSTFMREGYSLFEIHLKHSIIYISLTIILGILGFSLGYYLMNLLAVI